MLVYGSLHYRTLGKYIVGPWIYMKPPKKSPKNLRKTVKATMAIANSAPLEAPGVAAKRGEDPAVDGSHGGEEGEGVEDDDDDNYHEGGGGGGGGTAKPSSAPPPLAPPEPLPTSALQ